MKNNDAWLVVGMVSFMALTSLVFFFVQDSSTSKAIAAPVNYRALAGAPYTDLPYDGKPIEMPFAGRCYRDEGDVVIFQHAVDADVGRAFDGCYQAQDGLFYNYDYYCVGSPRMSQVWLKIIPGCNQQ